MTEQNREPSESGDSLERILQIIKEIAEKSADGDYLFRENQSITVACRQPFIAGLDVKAWKA